MITKVKTDVYNAKGNFLKVKNFYSHDKQKSRINEWIDLFKENENSNSIAFLMGDAPDFQNNSLVAILNQKGRRHGKYVSVNSKNLIQVCIYFSVRHSIKATWLNDRDQFLYPNKKWKKDKEFQNNCLTFTLFHGQNKITSEEGTNHWIPFSEAEVNARTKFDSNFMSKFISGKIRPEDEQNDIFTVSEPKTPYIVPLKFSPEAEAVFNAGRELWKYYHAQPKCNVNASLYDIKAYFQGRSKKGRMNTRSNDQNYTRLISELREKLDILAKKIEPKIYEFGFLKK